jgi:formate dehydrogenase maturation protein FdhE
MLADRPGSGEYGETVSQRTSWRTSSLALWLSRTFVSNTTRNSVLLVCGARPLGAALLQATASRPAAPLKLNFCLTYWCQYRCKTCNIWQRKPSDELTTDEVVAIVRENPNIT